MGRWGLVENESSRAETDEGENREKAENPVGEDVHATEGLCVVTKVGEESVAFPCSDWFR